jgi:3-hydroxyisobutyrate dehydrogenase-like beta-hydroxyacid dehydrogenase
MDGSNNRSGSRLGFIGLGAMGGRMASRLLAAGYDLTVYNRTRERTRSLQQRGAKVAATPAGLAASVDLLLSSVADDAALEEVMFGPDGALAGARPGTVFLEMSTVSPSTSRRLHDAAGPKGLAVLDAPVSGSTPQAEQGQLVIFVGGEEEVYRRCAPILAVLGKESFYMGPAGSGMATKLCVNSLLGVGVQALAEAIALGLKSGLPRERFLQVLGDTTVLSPSQKSKLENARKDEYPATFPLRLMFKDFSLVAQRAMELSVAMPLTAAAAQVSGVEHAQQSSAQADEDFSAVIRTMQQMAGLVEWTRGGNDVEA